MIIVCTDIHNDGTELPVKMCSVRKKEEQTVKLISVCINHPITCCSNV